MAAQRYSQPRKLNIVSFVLLVAGLAAIYSAVQFGPSYYRKWKTKGILSEAANKIYPRRMLSMNNLTLLINEVRKETLQQLRDIGIEDTTMTVQITKTASEIGVQAVYMERIVHPLVGKTTVLHFRPYNTLRIE